MPVPQKRISEITVKQMTGEEWLQGFCDLWKLERRMVIGVIDKREQGFALVDVRDAHNNELFYPIAGRDSVQALNDNKLVIRDSNRSALIAKSDLQKRGYSLGDLIIGELISSDPNKDVRGHLNSFLVRPSSVTKFKRIRITTDSNEIICDENGKVVFGIDINETLRLEMSDVQNQLEAEKQALVKEKNEALEKVTTIKAKITSQTAELERIWSLTEEATNNLFEVQNGIASERPMLLRNLIMLLDIRKTQVQAEEYFRKAKATKEKVEQTPEEVEEDDFQIENTTTLPYPELLVGEQWQELVRDIQAQIYQSPSKIYYPEHLIADFLTLIRTGDFFILSGEPGCGKSQMIRCFADAIGAKSTIIAVQPNWTSKEDLLGYYNPVQNSFASAEFLEALVRARDDENSLHLICLDEMNLARVENYFAYFLSHLEDRTAQEKIKVIPESELKVLQGNNDDSRRILKYAKPFPFPKNARIIGTVNFDETTQHFSPKLLDRTHVIRFPNPLEGTHKVEQEQREAIENRRVTKFFCSYEALQCSDGSYPAIEDASDRMKELLAISNDQLKQLGAALSARSYRQALNYAKLLTELGPPFDEQTAINQVILNKVIPRMNFEWRQSSESQNKDNPTDRRQKAITALIKKLKLLQLNTAFTELSALKRLEQLVTAAGDTAFFNGMG